MTRQSDLEEHIAHLHRQVEDLSDVVAEQAARLDLAERRIVMLLERAIEAEADGGSVTMSDQPPPHW